MEFAIEDGFLRIYTSEGERLRTHEESEQERQDLERRVAELEARLQPRRRRRPD